MISSPSGSLRWIGYVRDASEAGYNFALARLALGNLSGADEILNELTASLTPFDKSTPRGDLRIAFARLTWIKTRILTEKGQAAEAATQREKVLRLTTDFRATPSDFGPLVRLRILALWDYGSGSDLAASRLKACDLAREIERRVPGQMDNRLRQCTIEALRRPLLSEPQSHNLKLSMELIERELRFRQDLENRQDQQSQRRGASFQLFMGLMQSLGESARVARDNGRPEESARAQIRAAELMIDGLRNTTFMQQNTQQIWEAFSVFSNIEFKDISEFADARAANTKAADIFSRLLDAVEPTQRFYPGSRSIAAMFANTASLAATAKLRLNQPLEALGFANRGIAALESINFLSQGVEYEEMGTVICLTHGRAVEALVQLERADEAAAAFAKLRQKCGEYLRAYPWDFYSRSYMTNSSAKFGALLVKTGRTTEAVPVLRFASDWGVKDASVALAGLYRAMPASPENSAISERLEALAGRQSMIRFTVPTDFAGVKFPFNVYVSEFAQGTYCPSDRALKPDEENCIGFRGIDDQANWVKVARGGAVPADVISSFQKLSDLARTNNVSLPDLVAYALGAANSASATPAQASTIHAEMLRTKFWRSPDRALDEGGLALGGYDAVSYTQGAEPKIGNATHFVLWDNALWLFVSAENRATFVARPRYYAPQFGGYCSTCMADGKSVSPDNKVFLRQDDKLFLFENQAQREEWRIGTVRLMPKAVVKWVLSPGALPTVQKSDVAEAILKIGPVPAPSEFEAIRFSLTKRSLRIELVDSLKLAVLNPLLVSTLGGRSWTYALLNRPNEALADADRALAIDPNQHWIVGNKASALLLLNRSDEALSLYRTIKDQLGPDDKTPMCSFIREDVILMRDNDLLPAAIAARVLAEMPCQIRPQ
jgi:tetratricopeptide (TPR) repeat protein